MSDWKTIEQANAGIQFMDVKGKMYAPVNERLKAFRRVYPMGSIVTEIISEDDKVIAMKATVLNEATVLATGHAFEIKNGSYINKTSYMENCETSAIGRALGIAGFGIDAAICSAEELTGAEIEQDRIRTEELRREKIGIDRAIVLQELLDEANVSSSGVCEQYHVKALGDLTEEQHRNLVGRVNRALDKRRKK